MNKEKYFEISGSKKLVPRCPILNICERRAFSIYLFSHYRELYSDFGKWENVLKRNGELSESYFNNKVEMQGESASGTHGENFISFSHVCPEINLFEDYHRHAFVEKQACTSGDWDNFRNTNKFHATQFAHYSECAEYSCYCHNKAKKMTANKVRTKIPNKVRAELQKEVNSICPFCPNDDVGHFEVHHIDEDPSNNEKVNLILVCPTCHSKITKGDISLSFVLQRKLQLVTQAKPESDHKPKKAKIINLTNVANAVVGNNNRITINNKKVVKEKYPPGSLGFDNSKANYVAHLIQRFNEYKAAEVGKENVKYGYFGAIVKRQFKIPATRTINNISLDRYDELVDFIKKRIDNTQLAKMKGKHQKNYSTFEEFDRKTSH